MYDKKLQQDSIWAKYDIDHDGTVSDEEMARAEKMIELELREEKQHSQKQIVSESRLATLSSLSDMLFLSQASIIGLYFGATAYMSKKP